MAVDSLLVRSSSALGHRGGSAAAAPPLTGPVNDFANVIDAQSEADLERRIRALQQASGDVIVVATVPTMEPYARRDEFAVRMFENGGRGIGQKGKDNGALIVLALERKTDQNRDGLRPRGVHHRRVRRRNDPRRHAAGVPARRIRPGCSPAPRG